MSEGQIALLLNVVEALNRWAGIGPVLNAHRDCVARTCPGDAAYAQKPELQAELEKRLARPAPDPWAAWGTAFPLPPEQRAFGIPTTWYPERGWLKQARSFPIYSGKCVIQVFQAGRILPSVEAQHDAP
jgi:hypothetical protein